MDKKLRILLVDDEPSIVKMVSKRLETEGFEVTVAMDGQEGLEKVKALGPDLVVLDLMLPKLDGYKVCRLLKFDDRTRSIPILIFTARSQVENATLATECGADAYLTKPFTAPVLLAKIRELLEAAGRAGS